METVIRMVITRGGRKGGVKLGAIVQRVHTFSYKINNFWGSNI